jgi:hypothetical protein
VVLGVLSGVVDHPEMGVGVIIRTKTGRYSRVSDPVPALFSFQFSSLKARRISACFLLAVLVKLTPD